MVEGDLAGAVELRGVIFAGFLLNVAVVLRFHLEISWFLALFAVAL